MKHKCFISFKTEDIEFKNHIKDGLNVDMIDMSLNQPIESDDEDYIMRKIREDHLKDSTVTIVLIGDYSAENDFTQDQTYIKRELQASLYNSPNGILGIVLPSMYETIYKGTYTCSICGNKHRIVNINDSTTIKEFSANFYIEDHDGCAWTPEERYCILTKWDNFVDDPNFYIEQAFQKRDSPIVNKIKVFPK